MNKPVRTAIFPVGGLGTRFLPATKAMPKEMLPVVDKPLIQYAVEEAQAAGIERFVFVTGRGKSAIEDHFDHSADLHTALLGRGKRELWDLVERITMPTGSAFYTRQPEALGLGHAVWCARHLVQDEPFAVLLADDLILSSRPCLKDMVEAHAKIGGNLVAVMDVIPEHTSRYGIVDPSGDDGGHLVTVKGLVEKPRPANAPSNIAVIGRYVLDPKVFELLDRKERGAGGEIQLTDALADMIGAVPFNGFRFEGKRFDCGDKVGFLEANVAFGLARDDLGPELRNVLSSYFK
jgi:UTP--glucose-1-phosphate uridylyltransferase